MRSLRPLTNQERDVLEADLRRAKDSAEWKRLFVILTYDEGLSVEDLAQLTRLSKWTVEEYLKNYSSENKTKNDPRGGSESKLTDKEAQELEGHLIQKTYLKVKEIIAYVQQTFGKTYSRSGMTSWLVAHGFTYKRPQKVPGKINPEEQAKFVEQYKQLKDSLGPDAEIYFMDAVHPEHQSQAVRGWIKKGEIKTLQTSGKQLRLHFAGALNLEGMKFAIEEYETVDADAIIDFFKKLENQSKASVIHVILDNARSNKNKKLDEYLKTSKIRVHYLPPYSPNLNPIERLWKILREVALHNRYYPNSKECFAAIRSFFSETLPRIADDLANRINDQFQVIRLNPIILK